MNSELDEANKRIKQLEEQISQKNEELAEYRDCIKSLEHYIMWIMRYVVQLLDFRSKAIKILKDNDFESIKSFIKMKFPMLQTSNYHILFRGLSKYLNDSDFELKTGEVSKKLHEKYLMQ